MSITIEVDEKILRKASKAANISDPAELVRELLLREGRKHPPPAKMSSKKAHELAKSIAALGGTMPNLEMPRRRRVEDYL